MVLKVDEKLRKKMDRDGSVFKYMHGVAGAGLGLMAAGWMFVGIGVLFVPVLWSIDVQMALMAGGACALLGFILVAGGMALQNRRMSRWMHTYCKATGLPEEEIRRADAEFKEPGTILFAFEKGRNSNSLKKMGFITSHYIKFPGVVPYLARLDDMVACFYTRKFLCKDGGYDRAFVAYSRDQKMSFAEISPNEKAALEIVETILQYDPMIFHDHHFQYNGRAYDAARDMDEVIRLHDQIRAERAAQGVNR